MTDLDGKICCAQDGSKTRLRLIPKLFNAVRQEHVYNTYVNHNCKINSISVRQFFVDHLKVHFVWNARCRC